MNQGQFQALLTELRKSNELLTQIAAAKPIIIAVPSDADAASIMKEINAAFASPVSPKPKPAKAKPAPKRKPKAKAKAEV